MPKKKIALCLTSLMLFCAMALAAPVPTAKEVVSDLKKFDGQVGVYAKNIKTGKSLSFNENIVFPTASTSKLMVALAVHKYLYPISAADKKTLYDEDVKYMFTVSDNDAFYELLGELEAYKPDALKRVGKDLRLTKTQIHSDDAFNRFKYHSVTTPYEMAKVFETINADKYLGKQRSTLYKDHLASTIYNDEIPRFMETRVMHKTGELDNILCDVGIVDDGKDQILISIYTISDRENPYASDFMAYTAAKLYNVLRRK